MDGILTKRVRLTLGRIEAMTPPPRGKAGFLWDLDVQGLAVRCTPAGTKSFVFQARLTTGATCRTTIGRVGDWDTASARKRARELRMQIDADKDPREESRRKKQELERIASAERRGRVAAQSAWDAYIAARTPHWAPLTLRNHTLQASPGGAPRKHRKRKTKPGPLAPLLALRLAEIDSARVAAWLKQERAHRPSAAWLAFVMLRGFLNWAAEQDEYKGAADPTACRTLAVRTLLPKIRAKDDCLQREQLAAWFSAVRLLEPVTAAYLQALLLTGARRTEMATLTWDKADLMWNTITLGGKNGQRVIPLPPYCASLIAALPRMDENAFVFASHSGAGHIIDPSRSHSGAQARAGIAGLSLHGLRRSFATLAEWCDPPAGVIAQIMGHAPSAVSERHYKRRSVDFLRQWHDRIEAWFLDEAAVPFLPKEDGRRLRVVAGMAAAHE